MFSIRIPIASFGGGRRRPNACDYSLRSNGCGQMSQFTVMSPRRNTFRTCDFDDDVKRVVKSDTVVPAQVNQAELRSEDWDSWNAWVDGRIDAALEQHQTFSTEVTGAALGEIRADLRNEFRKELEAATGELGVELRKLIVGVGTELARLQTELARRGSQALETDTAGLRLRGAYHSDQDYDRLDIVTFAGSSYIARQDGPGPCPGNGWRIAQHHDRKSAVSIFAAWWIGCMAKSPGSDPTRGRSA
jgi:hypothetical protein